MSPPCCAQRGAAESLAALQREIAAQGLDDAVQVTPCDSPGLCGRGPSMIVYPEGLWYTRVTPEAAVETIREHLRDGRRPGVACTLAPGGLVLLQAFTPRQLLYGSGGPKDPYLLYEPGALRTDFARVSWYVIEEREVELDEGTLHRGKAMVVSGVGCRTG